MITFSSLEYMLDPVYCMIGMVPAFITNAVSRKQPLTLKRVGDFLDRDGLELISSSG